MSLILFTIVVLLSVVNCQREGEACSDAYTNTAGICVRSDKCLSAKNDLQCQIKDFKKGCEGGCYGRLNNGIQPTFCDYDAFDISVVCCRDDTTILNQGNSRVTDNRPTWNSNGIAKRVSERKCDEYSKRVVERVDYIPLVPNPEALSISSSKCKYSGVELIVGGENANQGEFPHMAAIGWASPDGYSFDCGGSLISSRFVLTAGHCTKSTRRGEPVIVRLGDQNIDSSVGDGADPIDIPIRRIHVHPDYNSPVVYNDIALLELATDADFNSDIRPACLWTKKDFGEHRKALATGWGTTDPITQTTSKELQKVSLSLLDNNYCDELLIENRNRRWREGFSTSQMCAGELRGGKDTCQGDSGSPLQVSSSNNHCLYYIIGVTSFGKSCAKSDQPGIYTRVSSYTDWIESIVWPGE